MKGDKKRRKIFFTKKHKCLYTKVKNEDVEHAEKCVKRSSESLQEFINKHTDHGLIHSITDEGTISVDLPHVDGKCTDFTMLRPMTSKNSDQSVLGFNNSDTYIVVHRNKMCHMWNKAHKDHFKYNKLCSRDLTWDDQCSKQWGFGWKAVLKCDGCDFKTEQYKLYEEAKTVAPGPKTSTVNLGIQVGLMKQGMSQTGMREILTSANISSPSKATMQRAANRVGEILIETNQEDLDKQCAELQKLNQAIGNPKSHPIPAETDATYNNRIFSGVGKTPFQAGTQCTMLVAENLTSKKKIISVGTYSKICSCKITDDDAHHKADCPANLNQDSSIGNEGDYLTDAIECINDRGISIGELTMDGDSSSRLSAQLIQQPSGAKIVPKYCTRHLIRVLERKTGSTEFSDKMFPGKTKEQRKSSQNTFVYDLGDRVNAEYDAAHKTLNGSIDELNAKLPNVCEAIIDCYRGDCRMCDEHSFVCKPDYRWPRPYLDVNPVYSKRRLFINAEREDLAKLREIISIRFSKKAIEKTSNNSTQNKYEASNRAIKKATPGSLTFKKNYSARVHSAVHGLNNGPGTSIRKLCEAVGSPISKSSKVYRETERMDAEKQYDIERQKSTAYKMGRSKNRKQRYRIYHHKKIEQQGYIKDGCLEDVLYIPPLKQKSHLKDHNYQSNKITVLKK